MTEDEADDILRQHFGTADLNGMAAVYEAMLVKTGSFDDALRAQAVDHFRRSLSDAE